MRVLDAKVRSHTTPDLAASTAIIGLQCNLGNNGELITTSAECKIEFWMGCCVGVRNCAIGQNALKVDDIVAGKSL